MQDLAVTLMSIFHPGDLGLKGLAILLFLFVLLIVLPVFLAGYIIYKIGTRK